MYQSIGKHYKMRKKHLILFTIILLSATANSQLDMNNLTQSWIQVQINMKDGSEKISYYPWTNRFMEFIFFENYYSYNVYPAETEKTARFNYRLNKNKIHVSKYFEYVIENLTSDSLTIVENIPEMSDDKLKRYFLVSKKKLVNDYIKLLDTLSKIDAKTYYSPKFEGKLIRYLNKKLKNTLGKTEFSGILEFLPKSSKLRVKILENESNSITISTRTIKALEKSFPKWNLEGFERFEQINIPFFFMVNNEGRSRNVRIKLFATEKNDLLADYGKSLKVMNESSYFFNKGLNAYQNKNYRLAITHFSKSYLIDPSFIDALYNRATTYLEIDEIKSACSDWLELKKLGQTKGKVLYLQNCD